MYSLACSQGSSLILPLQDYMHPKPSQREIRRDKRNPNVEVSDFLLCTIMYSSYSTLNPLV
jgi:hypothetical protein